MLKPVSFLYQQHLEREIVKSPIPVHHILLVLDETDLLADERGLEKLRQFVRWCHALGIAHISVYVSVIHDGMAPDLLKIAYSQLDTGLKTALRDIEVSLVIYDREQTNLEPVYARYQEEAGEENEKLITISLGFSGRSELTKATKEIAKQVAAGELDPDEIDEKLIESELLFKSEPDLVIRSGATRLMDFLIWQSVYTEFYFTDMNWVNFRKIDLLRAVRDFQMRERRYGR
ncbi:MAG: undecaprenyl diphosphate synthase family protein [Methanomicrobia archaeon]|nr:undecaprenyl diphosphate synthase family protein [Methanomicrobia archaeon]